MSRLIDADALHIYVADVTLSEGITWSEAEIVHDFLDNAPTIDITDTETCRKCQETTDRVLINAGRAKRKAERHGKWVVEKVQYSEPLKKYTCSECGDSFETVSDIAKKFNYCRSCGAKMEGVEHEAD